MIQLADIGALRILAAFFKGEFEQGGHALTLRLFTNDHQPADTDTAADYTEAAGGGYAPLNLILANFAVASVVNIAAASYPYYQFVFTGPLDGAVPCRGYYVTDGAGNLIFAERKPNDYYPVNDGDALGINLTFQLSKGIPA